MWLALRTIFYDNVALTMYYESKKKTTHRRALCETKLTELEKVRKSNTSRNTLFEQPDQHTVPNWNENIWTRRLYRSLCAAFPYLEVSYTAESGLQFAELLLNKLKIDAPSVL